MLAITFGSLVAIAAGCSAAGPPSERSFSAGPGCGNGDCSACGSCVNKCMCATHGDPACSSACASGDNLGGSGPGSGGSGPAAGGSGSNAGGSGPSGTGGSGPAAGGSGYGGSGYGGSGYGGSGYGGSGYGGSGYGGSGYGGSGYGGSGYGGSGYGGSGGSGSGGSGGTGGSGGSGTSVTQDAINRAKAGVGFSYWWAHGRFLPTGPTLSIAGSCSGNCPSCTHSGSYGGDCSGFAGKVWQVPSSNTDMSIDSHPYSTLDFSQDTSQWSTVDRGSMKQADAMVYRSGGAGHIFIYDHGDGWGSMYAYECKGCSYGCTADMRTASSSYHAIRRTGY